jgi:predicted nucleic acid-binding protein
MRIAEAIDEGLLRVASVRSRRKLPLALGRGEAAAIRLFLQERADLLLTDDGRAIRTCRLLAIPFTTTPRVVVDLHRDGALDTATARRALEKLAVVGRYTREIIAAALVALRET